MKCESSINKVILVGRVGKDPEIKSISSGSVANFSLATSESYKDKNGEKVETTEWSNCVAFGKLGDIIGQYVTKGSLLYVEGKLKTDKYTKDGVDKYSTKIVVNEMKMLGGKPDGSAQQDKPVAEPSLDDVPF